jgi:tRNA U34 5-methylaminomethyl-2-thiouridine-forming methyltransferase MnmC
VERVLLQTQDQSATLFVPQLNESYHSTHGALQESRHVYIQTGLEQLNYLSEINLLEIGFGTGLNALLSALAAVDEHYKINYTGIEKYPVKPEEWAALNYAQVLGNTAADALFTQLHQCPWEETTAINPHFSLHKQQQDLRTAPLPSQHFHLIYFDAFAPSAQAHLWTEAVFARMFDALQEDGLLVSYCVKGDVRRNMKAVGFEVEKVPGPPGKWEITRARKPITKSI